MSFAKWDPVCNEMMKNNVQSSSLVTFEGKIPFLGFLFGFVLDMKLNGIYVEKCCLPFLVCVSIH